MNNKISRPNWLVLVALIALGLTGFYLEANASLSRGAHILAEIGLLLVLFAFVMGWLNANKAAMMAEDLEYYRNMTMQENARSDRPLAAASQTSNHPIQNRRPGRSVSSTGGWSATVWVSAAWSFIAAQIHRNSWLD